MALDETPLVPVVHPVQDETPVDTNVGSADEEAPARSKVVDALFPPGSGQTALRQLDPFATRVPEEQAPADSGQVPTLLPPQAVPERETNPVDEIRRLAAEAMSGIERASKSDEAAAAASAMAAQATDAPARTGFDRTEFDSLPSESVNRADADAPVDSIGDWAHGADSAPATPSGGATPRPTGFDQLPQQYAGGAPASGQFAMPDQSGQQPQPVSSGQLPVLGQQAQQPASGQFPMPGQQPRPASGQFPMPGQQPQPAPEGFAGPQGPAWNSLPVNAEPGRAAEAEAFTPLSDVPRPDFSGLYKQGSPAAFPPLTGAINNAALDKAEFHDGDMTASGQVPALRRPDLPEVGGVKHFKWVHLSVIGALMFVLGVVIYNVAFNR